MSSVNKKTGEVYISSIDKFVKETVGRDPGSMIIQNQDFSWSEEIRDFVVVEGSKEDRQAYIDSFADECGVYNILKQFAKTGDMSLLNRSEGQYIDISGLPVDELNPAKAAEIAQSSVKKLSESLGVELTSDQLASMTTEQLNELIAKAVDARVAKAAEAPKKEGE